MQYTSNYNFLLPEGTDVVNPLVDVNPNFSTLDTIIKGVSDHAVDRAACTKTGTTHSVVRSNTSANVFEFTATGDWDTGDSMVVDGTPVSVFLPDGTAPLTGAYIINTEVLCIINGTRVTLLTGAQTVTSLDASDVVYDNTTSGLTATNAQDAIDELDASVDTLASTVSGLAHRIVHTAASNQTYLAQLTEIETYFDALSDDEKRFSKIIIGNNLIGGITQITNKAYLIEYGDATSWAKLQLSMTGTKSAFSYAFTSGALSVTNIANNNNPQSMSLVV